MFKMNGLDKLTKQLEEAQKAMEGINGSLGETTFEPEDPASIEAAIVEMESVVDRKMAAYAGNPLVDEIVESAKEGLRTMIIDKAQACRLGERDPE